MIDVKNLVTYNTAIELKDILGLNTTEEVEEMLKVLLKPIPPLKVMYQTII